MCDGDEAIISPSTHNPGLAMVPARVKMCTEIGEMLRKEVNPYMGCIQFQKVNILIFLKALSVFFKEDLVFSVPAGSLRKRNSVSPPAAYPAALGLSRWTRGAGVPGSGPWLSPLCAQRGGRSTNRNVLWRTAPESPSPTHCLDEPWSLRKNGDDKNVYAEWTLKTDSRGK